MDSVRVRPLPQNGATVVDAILVVAVVVECIIVVGMGWNTSLCMCELCASYVWWIDKKACARSVCFCSIRSGKTFGNRNCIYSYVK